MFSMLACVAFTACSDDDDNDSSDPNSIVGSWQWDDPESTNYMVYTFKSNGTFTGEAYEDGERYYGNGTYSLSGDILKGAILAVTISDEEGPYTEISVARISGSNLYLSEGGPDADVDAPNMVLRRIR